MARGSNRGRRNYTRDASGRFASTPGGGPARKRAARTTPKTFRQRQQASLDRRPGRGGFLGGATREARAKLKASRAKLKANATPQQKAAVTRAAIRVAGASPQSRMKLGGGAGVLRGAVAKGVKKAKGVRVKPAPKPVAPKPAARRARRASGSRQISPEKTLRVSMRINDVVNAARSKKGVKAMNAVQVGVRAKDFVMRKAGGMSGAVKMNFDQQQAAIRAGITKPPRYSTQKPNRNKPAKYNALGQDEMRAKAANPKLSRAQRDKAARARRDFGVESTVRNRTALSAESVRLRGIANAMDRREQQRTQKGLPANGTIWQVTDPMRAKAAKLDAIGRSNELGKLAREADARKRAKPLAATGNMKRDANRLRTLNKRLDYYRKQGYTPDDLNVQATRSARNRLASEIGNQAIAQGVGYKFGGRKQAARRMFRRLDAIKMRKEIGDNRSSVYRFPVNQQYNIFGGVDRARAPRGRKVGTRKAGSRRIDLNPRRR